MAAVSAAKFSFDTPPALADTVIVKLLPITKPLDGAVMVSVLPWTLSTAADRLEGAQWHDAFE